MRPVRLAASAAADLDHIFRWAATDSPAAAEKVVDDIETACFELAQFPERYPVHARPRGRQVRRRPLGRYNIYYEVTRSEVAIVRIIHSAREIEFLFPEG